MSTHIFMEAQVILMSIHDICFYEELKKIICS